MNKFKLPDEFIQSYAGKIPPWGPVGEITYKRTYERNNEGWSGTVRRVVESCYQYQLDYASTNSVPWDLSKAYRSATEMYNLIWHMKFLPPGRGLWAMGTDIRSGAALNNCGFVSTENDLVTPITWAMDMLMLGVGIGFDTLYEGGIVPEKGTTRPYRFIIDDSREGWVSSVSCLLVNLLGIPSEHVEFDYSKIRPKGAPIKGFGGTASGPEPLKELHDSITELFKSRAGSSLTSSDIVDLFNLIGRCVVAGNVRRSAEIAFGKPSDKGFLRLKDPATAGEALSHHRWASNNSVFCNDETDYQKLVTDCGGQPELGIMWLDHARDYGRMGRRPDHRDYRVAGANPCGEQSLESYELCCLVETFPSLHRDYYEYQKTLKYAYLYAKTVTLVPTHVKRTNAIVEKNRRIGCSMSGIVEAKKKFGTRNFLDNFCNSGYKYLKALDDRYSSWLNISRSIKITSVKPSGTVSKLPGVSSGVHYPPAEYYFQVIRFASDSPYLGQLRAAGYKCVDLSPNEPNTTAVYFGVKTKHFTRSEKQVSMWEQLELAAQMQHYWSDNQVSVTIKYHDNEKEQIPYALELYAPRLKSVSFLPYVVESFEHAPWQPCTQSDYGEYMSQLSPIDFPVAHEVTERFCDGEICTV